VVKRRARRSAPRLVVEKQKSKQKKQKEMTLLGTALRGLGGLGGTALGGLMGNPMAGGAVGTSLGAVLSKWLGSGDYTVAQNSIVKQSLKGSSSIPAMHSESQSVVIRHKEFLTEVRGSMAFNVQHTFSINPGNGLTFPWLSAIAANFQEYKIRGMVYHYIPSSGAAVSSTNAALGTVMLQTTYRANDTAPTYKAELLNEYWAAESVPSDSFCHPIECDPKENPFNVQYIRTGNVPAGDSTLMYDLGKTYVATSGQQVDNTVLGDLWITYEIELKKPLIISNVTGNIEFSSMTFTSPPTGTNIFPVSPIQIGNLDVTPVLGSNAFSIGAGIGGTFFIQSTLNASTSFTSMNFGVAPTLVNAVYVPVDAYGATWVTTLTSTGVSRGVAYAAIRITNPSLPTTVTFSAPSFAGAGSSAVLIVSRIG